jgi:hypothetical protein
VGHIVRIFEHNSGRSSTRSIILLAFLLFSTLVSSRLTAQAVDQVPELERPVPILTGNAGFFTNITGGETELVPSITPVLLLPLGDRWLVESRAEFEGEFERRDGGGPDGGTQKDGDSSPNDLFKNEPPVFALSKGGFAEYAADYCSHSFLR